MTKHFVALDSGGNALATLTARDKSDADAFALRKLPGYVAVLESGSGEVEDVDATLQKLYETAGMDSIKARIKVLNRSHAALHSYDLIAMEKAHAFAETEIDASDEDVKTTFSVRLASLVGPGRRAHPT